MIRRITRTLVNDFKACIENDPAATVGFWGALEILFTYAGFHAIVMHRLSHFLHTKLKIPFFPRFIAHISRFLTGIEIHPAAKIGNKVFIDHGMGVVIGETAEVGDGCVMFQGVTLGGTGKETGKRHPTIKENVMISTGAKVLGNITIGENSKIGAQSVVLHDVPPNCTVVGVPGREVIREGQRVKRGVDLNQVDLPDPIMERLEALQKELDSLHHEIEHHRQQSEDVYSTHQ